MKKILFILLVLFCCSVVKAQNFAIEITGNQMFLVVNPAFTFGTVYIEFSYLGTQPTTGNTTLNPVLAAATHTLFYSNNGGNRILTVEFGDGSVVVPAAPTRFLLATFNGGTTNIVPIPTSMNTDCYDATFVQYIYDAIILPLEWLSFKATPITADGANKVALAWETAAEKDVVDFNVERSDDGKVFTKIGAAIPAHNKVTKSSYTAYDDKPLSGVSYYRIRQTDTDGRTTVTKIESVTLNSKKAVGKFTFYPNPIQKGTPLSILTDVQGGFDFKVIDMTGRVMYNQKLQGNTELKGLTLAGGTYLYEILSGEQRISGKIFVAE